MSDISLVATAPAPGDVVVLRTGQVRYTVENVAIEGNGKPHYVVTATRRQTVRGTADTPAHEDSIQVEVDGGAWYDLVQHGASIVVRGAT